MTTQEEPVCDRGCSPRDSVDALLESWAVRRPDLDFSPVAVVTRLGRVRAHIDAELESVFRAFGLGHPDFEALVTLARVSGEHGVSQRRLADEIGITPGTVSVRIDRLAEQGLVRRAPDQRSKRNTLITLTGRGWELFERIVPAHLANEQRLLAALSEEDRGLLVDLLRKLLVEFEGSHPSGPGHDRLGLIVSPAHVTIGMRESVALPRVAGLLVRTVDPDSPAARAGLRPGDVLTEAGGRELRSSASLYAALREAVDGCVRLTLLRGNDRITTTITLTPGCSIDGRNAIAGRSAGPTQHVL
jgi:DNA-binding MarR family transcriptional regulator